MVKKIFKQFLCKNVFYVQIHVIFFRHLIEKYTKCGVQTSSSERTNKISSDWKWNDQIILQTLAEVFQMRISVFNVVNDVITRTGFKASQDNTLSSTFSIFLGMIGEVHYFSLRPLIWIAELPYSIYSMFLKIISTKNLNYTTTSSLNLTFSVNDNNCLSACKEN